MASKGRPPLKVSRRRAFHLLPTSVRLCGLHITAEERHHIGPRQSLTDPGPVAAPPLAPPPPPPPLYHAADPNLLPSTGISASYGRFFVVRAAFSPCRWGLGAGPGSSHRNGPRPPLPGTAFTTLPGTNPLVLPVKEPHKQRRWRWSTASLTAAMPN